MADSLITGNTDSAAASELRTARRLGAIRGGNRVRIQHAKAFFGSFPYKSSRGINQLVKRIVAEMIMVVAGGKFKQAVIVCHMDVWISNGDIGVADIWRLHG